jgi:alpha-N-arabinofuranosidase
MSLKPCVLQASNEEIMKQALAVFILGASFASAQTATIKVDTTRVENHVSPRMYASFVEMMAEDVKWGMTAEMVHDRSFEEAPDYLGLPAEWQLEPDERNDNVGAIRFAQTTEEAYPQTNAATNAQEHALKITLAPGDITDARRGLSQGHLSIRAGETYNGYVWIKAPEKQGYTGNITVALEEDNTDGKTYAQTSLPSVSAGPWKKYSFMLLPEKTDRFAKLTFLFGGKGTLYIDQISLEPGDAKDQMRSDSEAMIAKLRPSFMRWPGGNVAQDYHWQWGIGPRDLRPTWINKAWSNAPEPGDLGTDEYLALCERLHIEPSITVNVEGAGATAQEAAAWVEYVNGPATSKYGAMRAANGHPAPYAVKQWELGNEIFGSWVRGHVTAEIYANSAVRYAKAMRAVDPTIQLIAVGKGVMEGQDDWNSTVLRVAGPVINYLAIHNYTTLSQNATTADPRAQMMARAGEFEANYRHTGDLIAKFAPGRNIKLIVNEWNLFYGADVIESMEGAVYASRIMNGFERDGNIIDSNCISDLLNGWVGGIIQASRDRVYGTPQFYALKMYNDHLGTNRLQAKISSPELKAGVQSVDAVATSSGDGHDVYIKLSNANRSHGIKAMIDLVDFPYLRDVPVVLLSSTDLMKRNSFTKPDAVIPVDKTIQCSGLCAVDLPPDSVAVLTFRKRINRQQ